MEWSAKSMCRVDGQELIQVFVAPALFWRRDLSPNFRGVIEVSDCELYGDLLYFCDVKTGGAIKTMLSCFVMHAHTYVV